MNAYIRDPRPWQIAGAITSLLVVFSGCNSPSQATSGIPLTVSQSPKPMKNVIEEDYRPEKDVIVDSKSVLEEEKLKAKSPMKPTRNPWRFTDDWWNRMEE